MKIAIHAVDSKHFNLALAKIAAYHKNILGDEVEWYSPLGKYDIYYGSKIFNFTPDNPYPINALDIVRGGTGYSLTAKLPDMVDGCQPDYSIYPSVDSRTSYGFLSRGCVRSCKWCVVPIKEGKAHPYMDIDEVTQNGRRPYAVLMDNNILALPDYANEQLTKIIDKKYHVDFNQAMDARLITPEVAQMLARVKWINSIIRFGCDTPLQVEDCEKAISLILSYGYKGQFLMYCMLYGDINECYERLTHWRLSQHAKKVRVAAQPYRDPNSKNTPPQWQRKMARWAMRREFFTSCDFKDFKCTKGITGKDYFV